MAARIAIQRANVRDATGSTVLHPDVSVVGTNDDQVVVRTGPTEVLRLTGATVSRFSAKSWKITTAAGPEYLVEILTASGCGCGR